MDTNLFNRMYRAARLEADLYEEVEADPSTLNQAIVVVLLSSLAAGITIASQAGFGGLVAATLGALISWLVWAVLTYWIGTRLLPEPATSADLGELLRTIGFSSSPGVIRLGGVIPGVGQLFFLAGGIWMLVAMVIAVRQALDYQSTLRAVGVCFIGWLIQMVLLAIFFQLIDGVPTTSGGGPLGQPS